MQGFQEIVIVQTTRNTNQKCPEARNNANQFSYITDIRSSELP